MRMNLRRQAAKKGFSLVEVCLAVLVVGLGIMAIFSLFPTGLAASEAAETDTNNSLLAQKIVASLEAQASTLTWNDWQGNQFGSEVKIGQPTVIDGEYEKMAYYVVLEDRGSSVKKATVYVIPWRGATITVNDITKKGEEFYTEIYRMESPK